uniref:Uncharacterized protein n=1 Tax=Chenopodium quinoa TaxID=63459 RepID=A0A803N476_CHEQI
MSNKQVQKGSWAAKSMLRAIRSFAGAIGKRIGNGSSTSITRDIWVGKEKVKFSNTANFQQNAVVADLMTNSRQWNSSIVWRSFDAATARNILAIHIPEQDQQDEFSWLHEKYGEFSFRLGYLLQISNKNTQSWTLKNPLFWKKFWKLDLLPQWKWFI